MKFFIMLWLIVGATSCLQPEIPDIDPPCKWDCDTIAPTEIIWESEIVDEPEESISMEPKISDSVIIFSNKLYKNLPEIYKGYNRFSGKLIWSWQVPFGGLSSSSRDNLIENDQLLLSAGRNNYNISTIDGIENSRMRIQEFVQEPRINIFDDRMYFGIGTPQPSDTTVYLCSTDLLFARVDTLVKHVRIEGEVKPSISLEPPSLWVRPDGDTIAVYVLRGYTAPPHQWYEIHALNLSEKTENGYQELWMRDSFPYDDNCNVQAEPIFYRDSLLIFPGQSAVYGISLATGELMYSTSIPVGMHTTDFILAGDRVMFVDNPGNFYILDAGTGAILDMIPDCGGNVSNMIHHNGVVYFTSAGDGRLYAVDVENKEVIWRWKSPHIREQSYAQFTFAGVAIDRENGWLYTSDRVYAMCVEVAR